MHLGEASERQASVRKGYALYIFQSGLVVTACTRANSKAMACYLSCWFVGVPVVKMVLAAGAFRIEEPQKFRGKPCSS